MTSDISAAALAVAALGIPVFPCAISKAPTCPGGFKAATVDPKAIRTLWRCYPGPLIGVPTGPASGLSVLDIDAKHAPAHAWWAESRARLPATRTHRTRGRGLHLLFRYRPGLRCSAGRIAVGIDVRADGGCIVWWPAAGLAVLDAAEPAEWPTWLLPPIQAAHQPGARPTGLGTPAYISSRAEAYAAAALRSAAARVASAPEGTRNDTLNREAWSLLRHARLSAEMVAYVLAGAGLAAGLSTWEVQATLTSALRARGGAA